MRIIEPLEKLDKNQNQIVVFLAGTCAGKNWRKDLINFLQDMNKTLDLNNLVIINPYRKDWPNEYDKLQQQVEWECQMLNKSDIFSMYLDKGQKNIGTMTMFQLGKAIYQMKNLGITKFSSRLALSANKNYVNFQHVLLQIQSTLKFLKAQNESITLEEIDNINKHGSKIIENYFKLLK